MSPIVAVQYHDGQGTANSPAANGRNSNAGCKGAVVAKLHACAEDIELFAPCMELAQKDLIQSLAAAGLTVSTFKIPANKTSADLLRPDQQKRRRELKRSRGTFSW